MKNDDKDSGAELIHQAIPDVVGTVPRPNDPVLLYLDDVRPIPDGWKGVRTLDDAKAVLAGGDVEMASLDHDLGACVACMNGKTVEEWLSETGFNSMPHCEHVGTGYDLVCWMEETGHWPKQKPHVHSANPVGGFRMRQAINRHFDQIATGNPATQAPLGSVPSAAQK